jgi:MFS family permease
MPWSICFGTVNAVVITAETEGLEIRRPLRQVALASYVGSAIEFYDFFIYGTAAALVFPTVFFPNLGHVLGTVASLGTFATAFLARPVGAAVFGHIGDRIGRTRTLIFTLMIMGISTVGVGLLPSTATIGAAAPLLLVTLRLLQGFAVGGEWGGAALLGAEYAPADKRGRYGMATQLGLGTALVLANLVFFAVNAAFGVHSAAFLSWGWRIPFLLSGVLIVTALFIRLNVAETPVFLEAGGTHDGVPIAALMRNHGKQTLLAAGSVIGLITLAYQVGTYFTHYATAHLGYSMNFVLFVGIFGGLCAVATVAAAAILSDRYGQRRVIAFGYCLAVPWSLLVFPLVETRSEIAFAVATMLTYAIIGICTGPMAAFLPWLFPPEYRYTGAGLSYNVGGIIGGALPPVISEPLQEACGGWAVGVMMAAFTGVSLLAVLLLRDDPVGGDTPRQDG